MIQPQSRKEDKSWPTQNYKQNTVGNCVRCEAYHCHDCQLKIEDAETNLEEDCFLCVVCYGELRTCDPQDLEELIDDLMREHDPKDWCGRPRIHTVVERVDPDNRVSDENAAGEAVEALLEVTALSKMPDEDDEEQLAKDCDDVDRVIDKHSWIYPNGPRGHLQPKLDLDPVHLAHIAECIRQRDIMHTNKLWDERLESAWRTLWLTPEKIVDVINSMLVMLGKNFVLEKRKDGEDRKAMVVCFTELPDNLRTLIDEAIARRLHEREQQEQDELNAQRAERGRLSREDDLLVMQDPWLHNVLLRTVFASAWRMEHDKGIGRNGEKPEARFKAKVDATLPRAAARLDSSNLMQEAGLNDILGATMKNGEHDSALGATIALKARVFKHIEWLKPGCGETLTCGVAQALTIDHDNRAIHAAVAAADSYVVRPYIIKVAVDVNANPRPHQARELREVVSAQTQDIICQGCERKYALSGITTVLCGCGADLTTEPPYRMPPPDEPPANKMATELPQTGTQPQAFGPRNTTAGAQPAETGRTSAQQPAGRSSRGAASTAASSRGDADGFMAEVWGQNSRQQKGAPEPTKPTKNARPKDEEEEDHQRCCRCKEFGPEYDSSTLLANLPTNAVTECSEPTCEHYVHRRLECAKQWRDHEDVLCKCHPKPVEWQLCCGCRKKGKVFRVEEQDEASQQGGVPQGWLVPCAICLTKQAASPDVQVHYVHAIGGCSVVESGNGQNTVVCNCHNHWTKFAGNRERESRRDEDDKDDRGDRRGSRSNEQADDHARRSTAAAYGSAAGRVPNVRATKDEHDPGEPVTPKSRSRKNAFERTRESKTPEANFHDILQSADTLVEATKEYGLHITPKKPPKETKAERNIKAEQVRRRRLIQQDEERDRELQREANAELREKKIELGMRPDDKATPSENRLRQRDRKEEEDVSRKDRIDDWKKRSQARKDEKRRHREDNDPVAQREQIESTVWQPVTEYVRGEGPKTDDPALKEMFEKMTIFMSGQAAVNQTFSTQLLAKKNRHSKKEGKRSRKKNERQLAYGSDATVSSDATRDEDRDKDFKDGCATESSDASETDTSDAEPDKTTDGSGTEAASELLARHRLEDQRRLKVLDLSKCGFTSAIDGKFYYLPNGFMDATRWLNNLTLEFARFSGKMRRAEKWIRKVGNRKINSTYFSVCHKRFEMDDYDIWMAFRELVFRHDRNNDANPCTQEMRRWINARIQSKREPTGRECAKKVMEFNSHTKDGRCFNLRNILACNWDGEAYSFWYWRDLFQHLLDNIDPKYRPKRAEIYDVYFEELNRGWDKHKKAWTVPIVGKLVDRINRKFIGNRSGHGRKTYKYLQQKLEAYRRKDRDILMEKQQVGAINDLARGKFMYQQDPSSPASPDFASLAGGIACPGPVEDACPFPSKGGGKGLSPGKGKGKPGAKKPWVCRFWLQGTCKFGDKCLYQHTQSAKAAPSEDEQASSYDDEQDAAAMPTGTSQGDDKNRPCHAHFFKLCFFGGQCRYSHDEALHTASFKEHMAKTYAGGKFTGKVYSKEEATRISKERLARLKSGTPAKARTPVKKAAPGEYHEGEASDPQHSACNAVGYIPCVPWFRYGKCKYADKCRNSHNEDDISMQQVNRIRELGHWLERSQRRRTPSMSVGRGTRLGRTPRRGTLRSPGGHRYRSQSPNRGERRERTPTPDRRFSPRRPDRRFSPRSRSSRSRSSSPSDSSRSRRNRGKPDKRQSRPERDQRDAKRPEKTYRSASSSVSRSSQPSDSSRANTPRRGRSPQQREPKKEQDHWMKGKLRRGITSKFGTFRMWNQRDQKTGGRYRTTSTSPRGRRQFVWSPKRRNKLTPNGTRNLSNVRKQRYKRGFRSRSGSPSPSNTPRTRRPRDHRSAAPSESGDGTGTSENGTTDFELLDTDAGQEAQPDLRDESYDDESSGTGHE